MSGLRFDDTLGAAFIGFTCAAVLYGILITQIYIYFQRYKLDRPVYKFFVVTVWLLETFHSAFTGHAVYHYAITSFNNPIALLVPTWTVIMQVLFGAMISVLVKSAFAMRVWRFSNQNAYLCVFIMVMNCAVFGLAIIFCYKAFHMETFLHLSDLQWVSTAVLSTSVAADIVIAASLTYYLHHLRRNMFAAKTLVNALMKYSIETGAITSVCGIACLVAFDAYPSSFVYMSFYFVLSKLYSNSLLATLNTRKAIKFRGTERSHEAPFGEFTMIRTGGGGGGAGGGGQIQTAMTTNSSRFGGKGDGGGDKQTHDIEGNVNVNVNVDVIRETMSCPGDSDPRGFDPAAAAIRSKHSMSTDDSHLKAYFPSCPPPHRNSACRCRSCEIHKQQPKAYECKYGVGHGYGFGYVPGVHRTTISTTTAAMMVGRHAETKRGSRGSRNSGRSMSSGSSSGARGGDSPESDSPQTPLPDYRQAVATLREPEMAVVYHL